MRKHRYLWLVGALTALVLVAGACNGEADPDPDPDPDPTETEETGPAIETLEAGVLTVGSDIPYPPFEYREGGEVVGFDIDLITEAATRLGLEVSVIDTDFDTIFTQLAGGRFDVVASATTITPEREEEINFTEGYYNSQQSLTVLADSGITSVDELGEEHSVSVQRGTTGEAWAEENLAPQGVTLRTFQQTPDLYAAVEGGAVDGTINDEPSAIVEVAAREGLEIVQTIDTGEVYGFAVNPANEPLLDELNRVLAEMIEDGAYEQIYAQYPDLPPGGNVAAG
ncbi:MAG TPA: ABC transporter substrate-binding protein [Actinomycetota bacterium]|nr:ABC transporter substrate-binding protein [Actinomycetota bacterium]